MGKYIDIVSKLNEKKEYEIIKNLDSDGDILCKIEIKPLSNDILVYTKANVKFSSIMGIYKNELLNVIDMISNDFDINKMQSFYEGNMLDLFCLRIKNNDNNISIEVVINGEFEDFLINDYDIRMQISYLLFELERDIESKIS